MNTGQILDQVLQSGREWAEKTREIAEKSIGVPSEGLARESMLSGLGKGAVAGGLLTLLLGNRAARAATSKALKYGSLAAVASVAFKSLQAWQTTTSVPAPNAGKAILEMSPEQADDRANLLVRAMISAANADGNVNAVERATIVQEINKMGLPANAATSLAQDVNSPLSASDLAKQVDSMAAASEVYLISSLMIDEASPAERQYLVDLAKALGLPPELIERLNNES